ncbi:AlpA family phage regulatory protein [Vibrio breoganii]|uniref:helix-turn-helix transcriptional regulator n=1 Tax=Vibrio breoganii TaxID=553239 RepID=UPI000C82A78D|nr:AlpA family phage regulatory protein [Vibrio breoganii]PMG35299.1 AlpA family phage regulatory protein [Vibrio breoganii]PMG90784.1 AlpA family phage regulatory protein [Vibrio breoganii]PMH12897.1 AlpA family phage regulatory protein [Vibrio breoganii]PML80807.1 AlpA family phage regulatory protein [Vibrio breoganii]PML95878.1 AlpA family phage regulatory protein [Vibrio breoganii]
MLEKLVSYQELEESLGRSRKTIWRWVQQGKFPKPVKMNGITAGWKKSAIESWFAEQ